MHGGRFLATWRIAVRRLLLDRDCHCQLSTVNGILGWVYLSSYPTSWPSKCGTAAKPVICLSRPAGCWQYCSIQCGSAAISDKDVQGSVLTVICEPDIASS